MKNDRPFVVHIRAKDENGNVENRGGGTVVFVPKNNDMYRCNVGWSICHPNDNFDKELGVRIATGRAKTGRDVTLQKNSVDAKIKAAHNIFIDLIHQKEHITDVEERMEKMDLIGWVTGDYAEQA